MKSLSHVLIAVVVLFVLLLGLVAAFGPMFSPLGFKTGKDSVNLDMLKSVLKNACNENTHFVLLGDSRTMISGSGPGFILALNQEFYERYGKLGATPVVGGATPAPMSNGGITGYNAILGIGSRIPQTPNLGTDSPVLYPPYIWIDKNRMNSEHEFGWLLYTDWDGSMIHDLYEIPSQTYFKMGDEIIAEVFLRAGSGFPNQLKTRVNVADVDQMSPGDGNVYSWETYDVPKMGSDGAGFISYTQSITQHSGVPGDQVNVGLGVKAANPGEEIEFLAARWISTEESGGIALSAFSSGGYSTRSHLTNHAKDAKALAALNPDLLIIFLDVNDAAPWLEITPEEYKANMLEMISRYRDEAGENAPVLLLSGFPVDDMPYPSQVQKYRYDFPAKLREIALSESNVAWIDGWKIYEDRADFAGDEITNVHLAPGADSHEFAKRIIDTMLKESKMKINKKKSSGFDLSGTVCK